VTSTGSVTTGQAFTASASGGARFNNVSAGSVAIASGGTTTLNGLVSAPTIAVTSGDIAIAGTASIGGAGTSLVSLAVRQNGNQTVIGGDSQGPGYTLTDAEADRIQGQRLLIQAPAAGTGATRPPDLLVRDLSFSASRTGRVDIVTPGIAQVSGELRLADAGSASALLLQADERLEIPTGSGAVRVVGPTGSADGSLDLSSRNIWAASSALLQQLAADPNFAGRDAALLVNDGPLNSRGSIEAGRATLSVGNSLFVQNSGAFLDYAGITVRDGLTIVPTGAQPIQAFAFGRRINADGSAVTGNNFFRQVTFTGRGTAYAGAAQFNLCFINSGVCRLSSPGDGPPGGPDIIEEPVQLGASLVLAGGEADDLVDTSFADDPLIEEPVTSGGDSSLWEADCDRDEDGDCDLADRP
jgi:hypothetical protein